MSSKYVRLKEHFESIEADIWSPNFSEIERILGFVLPPSAYKYRAWWANKITGHPQSDSWLEMNWSVDFIGLETQQVTFCRHGKSNLTIKAKQPTKRIRKQIHPLVTYDWDTSNTLSGELVLKWNHLGAVRMHQDKMIFPTAPPSPGLYRMRILMDGSETRYVGETENLERRFSQYCRAYESQMTNVRINNHLLKALSEGAAIAISVITQDAWITKNGIKTPADLSNQCVRRLFERFAQVFEFDNTFKSLNL